MEAVRKISGVVITYNEEENIERCLKSLQPICDELLVIDSHSTDQTVQIAQAFGATVITNDFEGHIQQKNFARLQAKNEWVLSLDADEEISEELKQSLQQVDLKADGYAFNRLTNYCGKWIHHCGWYPDTKLRLFKNESGAWGGKNPHDRFVLLKGKTEQHIKGDLLHYTFYHEDEHIAQIKKFSSIAAKAYYEQGIRSNAIKTVFAAAFKFVRNYILKLGFLDGKVGFQICRLSAWATYLKYQKLVQIQKGKTL